MNTQLTFRANGTFTIVQFTDIHWQNGEDADVQSRRLMAEVLEVERPDLVVMTGDIVAAYGTDEPLKAFDAAVSVLDEAKVPWTFTFGNHDTERMVTREQMIATAQLHPLCLAQTGPGGIQGVGNHVIEIRHSNCDAAAALLYFLDSGVEANVSQVGGYGWIHRSQIDWYASQSLAYTQRNGGHLYPALAFFHIPLPEYQQVWDTAICYGSKLEDVCCPRINSGLFATMVEMGDVMGTFVGHDHVNDYWGTLHGIRLCYGRATGFHTYGKNGFMRGARVIKLLEGQRGFDTWLRLEGGTLVSHQPVHHPSA